MERKNDIVIAIDNFIEVQQIRKKAAENRKVAGIVSNWDLGSEEIDGRFQSLEIAEKAEKKRRRDNFFMRFACVCLIISILAIVVLSVVAIFK